MTNAKRDENHVPTAIASLNDNASIVRVQVNASNNSLKVDNNTTGSDAGNDILIDENHVPILMGVSSADGETPIAIYADSNGKLLINSL